MTDATKAAAPIAAPIAMFAPVLLFFTETVRTSVSANARRATGTSAGSPGGCCQPTRLSPSTAGSRSTTLVPLFMVTRTSDSPVDRMTSAGGAGWACQFMTQPLRSSTASAAGAKRRFRQDGREESEMGTGARCRVPVP